MVTPAAGAGGRLLRGSAAVIGPGRVGLVLVGALGAAGHRVVATGGGGSRSRERVTATYPQVRAEKDPAAAAAGCDLVLVATPDDTIAGVVRALAVAGAVGEGQHVVHVAGAYGLDPLRPAALAGARIAACHPAQTVPAGAGPHALDGATWAVTATPADAGWAWDLVRQLHGHPHDVPDDRRVLYHAALSVASNAVGAAVVVARQLLAGARVEDPAAFLAPLVERSVGGALARGADALTGPVVRGDAHTVARHLEALDADVPVLAGAYRHLTEVILSQVSPALEPRQVAALRAALRGGGAAGGSG